MTQDFVKMTLPQAKEARGKQDKYALCVVPLGSSEIDDEGMRISWRKVLDVQPQSLPPILPVNALLCHNR